jgi:hypothetical protein
MCEIRMNLLITTTGYMEFLPKIFARFESANIEKSPK